MDGFLERASLYNAAASRLVDPELHGHGKTWNLQFGFQARESHRVQVME